MRVALSGPEIDEKGAHGAIVLVQRHAGMLIHAGVEVLVICPSTGDASKTAPPCECAGRRVEVYRDTEQTMLPVHFHSQGPNPIAYP